MASGGGRQMTREDEKVNKADSTSTDVELPLESSPYVNYTDLEDYKRKGYGTEGHLKVVDKTPAGGGGGGTDAPTISGSGLSEGQVKAAESSFMNKVHNE